MSTSDISLTTGSPPPTETFQQPQCSHWNTLAKTTLVVLSLLLIEGAIMVGGWGDVIFPQVFTISLNQILATWALGVSGLGFGVGVLSWQIFDACTENVSLPVKEMLKSGETSTVKPLAVDHAFSEEILRPLLVEENSEEEKLDMSRLLFPDVTQCALPQVTFHSSFSTPPERVAIRQTATQISFVYGAKAAEILEEIKEVGSSTAFVNLMDLKRKEDLDVAGVIIQVGHLLMLYGLHVKIKEHNGSHLVLQKHTAIIPETIDLKEIKTIAVWVDDREIAQLIMGG